MGPVVTSEGPFNLYSGIFQRAAKNKLRGSLGFAFAEINALLQSQLIGTGRAQAPTVAFRQTQKHAATAKETCAYPRMKMKADGVGEPLGSKRRLDYLNAVLTAKIITLGTEIETAMVNRSVGQPITIVLHFQKDCAFQLF